MKKGKTSAFLVLAVEITTIVILHAVRLYHPAKNADKEVGKSINSSIQQDSRIRSAITMATLR